MATDAASPEEPEDGELMRRLARDDTEALRTLVQRHQGLLMNFFVRSGAQSHAEDLVQETLVRLYRYRKKYRPIAKFTTFLHTLARHVWIDHLRRKHRWDRLLTAWGEEKPDRDERSAGIAARRMDAEQLVAALSEEMRSVVVLVIYQGLAYQDAAEVLGVPVGTVKSRMFNALRRMKCMMEPGSSINHETER